MTAQKNSKTVSVSIWRIERELWPAKLAFIFFGFSQTMIANYIAVFFTQDCQYNSFQVGLLLSIPGLCSLVAPPIWGIIADVLNRQRLIHNICLLSASVLMYLLYHIRNFPLMCVLLFLGYFQTAPTYSLLDQAVMKFIEVKVNGESEYGKQRMFGAIGNGFGALLAGFLAYNPTFGMHSIFILHVVFAICCYLILQKLPTGTPEKVIECRNSSRVLSRNISDLNIPMIEEGNTEQKESIVLPNTLRSNFAMLLKNNNLLCVYAIAICFGLLHGILGPFLSLHLLKMSNNASIIGLSVILETVSEFPAFFFAGAILRRFGIVKILFISCITYVIRFFFYSVMTNPWTALPFALFHGLNYSLTWAALTEYVFKSSPAGLDGTTLGLLNGFYNGLGRIIGSILGGYIIGHYSYQTLWSFLYSAMVPINCVGVIILAFIIKRSMKKTNSEKNTNETEELEIDRLSTCSIIGQMGGPMVPGIHYTPRSSLKKNADLPYVQSCPSLSSLVSSNKPYTFMPFEAVNEEKSKKTEAYRF